MTTCLVAHACFDLATFGVQFVQLFGQRGVDPLGRTDGHGALVDHDAVTADHARQVFRHAEDEAQVLRDVTAWWKDNRAWMGAADILRLDSADSAILAEQQQARDGSRFVVFAGRRESSTQIANRPLRLTALDPDAMYRVTLRNSGDATMQSRGPVALKDAVLEMSGAALMGMGLQLPISYPDSMWVLEGTRL